MHLYKLVEWNGAEEALGVGGWIYGQGERKREDEADKHKRKRNTRFWSGEVMSKVVT